MFFFILSLIFLLATIPVIVLVRMVSLERELTVPNILISLLIQSLMTIGMLWLSTRLGPITPGSVTVSGLALLGEAVFRGLRAYARS